MASPIPRRFVVSQGRQVRHRGRAQGLLKEKTRALQIPAFIEFVPELPKPATGKIQRFRLRELQARA